MQEPQAETDSLSLGRFLGQEDRVDVRKNATLRDGDALEDLAKLLIVHDSQLEVAGDALCRNLKTGRFPQKAGEKLWTHTSIFV